MFSPAIEKQRQQLYAQTAVETGERLRAITEPAEVFGVLRWGMQLIEQALIETPAKFRTEIACAAGCSHCCRVAVDVQAHEVLLAADYIQLHFNPGQLAGVIERTAVHRRRLAGLTGEQRARLIQPCALLDSEGRCTIYEDRPEACRVHHTSDADVCAAHLADPSVDLGRVFIPALRARLFAVMLGMDSAIEAAGFDDRSYDLGSALHEALTNSLCRVLWLRHRPAFSDDCLAENAPKDA
jgi:Fe-S-cluster containining protein